MLQQLCHAVVMRLSGCSSNDVILCCHGNNDVMSNCSSIYDVDVAMVMIMSLYCHSIDDVIYDVAMVLMMSCQIAVVMS